MKRGAMGNDEVLATLGFYEVLAHRLAGDARNLYLEANALSLQLKATMNQIYREEEERKYKRSRWQRFVDWAGS